VFGGHRVSVVIPAYQAANTIGQVIRTLPGFVDLVVVVDDGSTDGTAQISASDGSSRVVCLRHHLNQGVGAAVVTGFRHALSAGMDTIIKMDADGQMDPTLLPDLLNPIVEHGFDYAKGNRFYDLLHLRKMPLARRWGNVVLSFLTKAASGYWNVYDPQNGYTAIRADVLRKLDLDSLDPGYFFENSMLVQLNIINARVAEVPMSAVYGGEPSSMSLWRVVFSFPRKLLCAGYRRLRLKYFGMDFSPVAILIIIGGFLFVAGASYGAYKWISHAIAGVPTPPGAVMLAALPVLLGAQLLLNALLLDIAGTPPGLGVRRVAGFQATGEADLDGVYSDDQADDQPL